MAAKHPKSVLAAVETLATANPRMTATDIRNVLSRGDFPDLAPYELPESTTRYHASKARRELSTVPANDVDLEEMTDALERKSAARIRDDIRRIHARTTLTEANQRELASLHRTLAGIVRERKRRSGSQQAKAGESGRTLRDGKPSALLTRLGEEIEARAVASDLDEYEAAGEAAAP